MVWAIIQIFFKIHQDVLISLMNLEYLLFLPLNLTFIHKLKSWVCHTWNSMLLSCPNKCLENLPFSMCNFNILTFTYYQEGHKIRYTNFPLVFMSYKMEYDARKGKLLFLSSETARRAASNATSRLQVMTLSLQNSGKFKWNLCMYCSIFPIRYTQTVGNSFTWIF